MPGTAHGREEAQDGGVFDVLELPFLLADAGTDVLDLLHLPAQALLLLRRAELALGVAEFVEVADFVDGGIRFTGHVGIGIDLPVEADILLPVVGLLILLVVESP